MTKDKEMLRRISEMQCEICKAPAHWVSPCWLWFTVFVGANLLQSGLTRWCLLENILAKFGVARKDSGSCCG